MDLASVRSIKVFLLWTPVMSTGMEGNFTTNMRSWKIFHRSLRVVSTPVEGSFMTSTRNNDLTLLLKTLR